MSAQRSPRRTTSTQVEIILLLTAVILVSGLMAMRYGGLWGETDTNALASAIRAMLAEGRLVPEHEVYTNGYGFPALATFLVHVARVPLAQLQLVGGALLAVWLVIPAWLAYRALIGSARGATVATGIILAQPEFLFPVLRGSHEKFSRGLIFLCIYLLVYSVQSRGQWRRFAASLIAFYLTLYGLITFNNLLATSFIIAMALSLALSLLLRPLRDVESAKIWATRWRLSYGTAIAIVMIFIFTFYAYPPARNNVLIIRSIVGRLTLLFFDRQTVAINPYHTVSAAWISLPAYLVVSSANWLLLAASFVTWSMQSVNWWRGRSRLQESRAFLLWSFYGAFGFLVALSVAIDVSGSLGSNLQHRTFPSLAMIAAAVVAEWVVRQKKRRPLPDRLVPIALAAGMAVLGIVAVFKASNEPALSNKWIFYSQAEFAALKWVRTANPDEPTWTSFDERLQAAIGICCAWEASGTKLDGFQPGAVTRSYLISDIIKARSEKLDLSLPVAGDSLRVYDNGSAQIYRLRPRTPFQK